MEPSLPVELIIHGYPVSHQAKKKGAREEWKQDVYRQAWQQLEEMQEGHFALDQLIVATIFFFPQAVLEPDLDNATKPILDGLTSCAFTDDKLIERLVIQRFEPDRLISIGESSPKLEEALDAADPIVYVKLEAFDTEAERAI